MTSNDRNLANRLRITTQGMHRTAEQSGLMQRLLRGQVNAAEYAWMLRNLHALYTSLETALDRHASNPEIAPVRISVLYRTAALADDHRQFQGPNWQSLPLTTAIRNYVARLEEISLTAPALLVAHAYVRYLGDLSGGQLLGKLIRRSFELPAHAGTAFYDFGDSCQADLLKEQFRNALNGLPVTTDVADAIVREASAAFERHVALFAELDQSAQLETQGSMPPPAA